MKIGIAGWNIPATFRASFPEEGSHLSRYSKIFNAVEINSTFYKFHQAKTFARWSEETPDDFSFSIKLHQSFTHKCELKPKVRELKEFFSSAQHLGQKWKVLLLQFPGKMDFHPKNMERFYALLRKNFDGSIVIEPRNDSWMNSASRKLLKAYNISKVIADPERCEGECIQGGIHYYRLHGSPVIYRSAYTDRYLKALAKEIRPFKNAWVMFDNTTFGAATGDALKLKKWLL